MKFLIPLFIIVIIVLSILLIKSNNTTEDTEDNKTEEEMPYTKKLLLTKNEWTFYKKIKPICDKNNLHILSKVRLADLVDIKKGVEYKERQKYFNKIKNKHVDFVLCNPDNLAIITIVELDDKSHEQKDRQKSDEFKNKLFETVGYKIIRVTNGENFEEELKNKAIIKKEEQPNLDTVTQEF